MFGLFHARVGRSTNARKHAAQRKSLWFGVNYSWQTLKTRISLLVYFVCYHCWGCHVRPSSCKQFWIHRHSGRKGFETVSNIPFDLRLNLLWLQAVVFGVGEECFQKWAAMSLLEKAVSFCEEYRQSPNLYGCANSERTAPVSIATARFRVDWNVIACIAFICHSMNRFQKLLKKMPFNSIPPQVQSINIDAFLSSARFPKQNTIRVMDVNGMFLQSCRIKIVGKICDRQYFVDWHILCVVQEFRGGHIGVDSSWVFWKRVFQHPSFAK